MAQKPVAIVTTVEDVVVIPDDGQIVITLNVGGLEPDLSLRLVDACAKGYAGSLDVRKVPKESRTLFSATGFEVGQNEKRGIIGLTMTFGMGGHLSFALDDVMANNLFEMLGVVTGRVTHAPDKSFS
jgi:hypothetical protein